MIILCYERCTILPRRLEFTIAEANENIKYVDGMKKEFFIFFCVKA